MAAHELAQEIRHGLIWHQHQFKAETGKDYLESTIARIQLDAMKEGMRRATDVLTVHNRKKYPTHVMNEELVQVDAILTAAEQLTEKDL
jgi:hypothetical protein